MWCHSQYCTASHTHQWHPQDVLTSVAPKKANWDLKREIAPKLDKLERRTQRAMVQLLQQEEARRQAEAGDGE